MGIHRPLRARARRLRARLAPRPRSARPRAPRSCRWPRRPSRTPSWSRARLGSLVPAEDPFVARNEAGWRDGVLVHVPARGQGRPSRSGSRCRSSESGSAIGWRTLVVLEEGAEAEVWEHWSSPDDDVDALLNSVVELQRRPGGDAALRQHPGHLRVGLDLRHPARPGRARRPPRLGRARLRLGPRQGADGDQAGGPGLRGAGHRRLRRRARPAPRLRHDPGARGARTPTPTSPSAASSPPARPRSGAG